MSPVGRNENVAFPGTTAPCKNGCAGDCESRGHFHCVQGPFLPDVPIKASAPRNISLNHGSPAAGVETTLIINKLTQRLSDAGITVASGQPIKLVVESKAVDQHDVTYPTHGRNVENHTVTIADTIQSIAFMMDGKPLWRTDSVTLGSAPMFVFRTKGQSIADAVNEQNKPKMEWFLQTGIPRTLLKPADPQGSSPLRASRRPDAE